VQIDSLAPQSQQQQQQQPQGVEVINSPAVTQPGTMEQMRPTTAYNRPRHATMPSCNVRRRFLSRVATVTVQLNHNVIQLFG